MVAGVSARFWTVMRMRTSSVSALAYSTVTSKYLLLSKTPVSWISNSRSRVPRRAFSATSWV